MKVRSLLSVASIVLAMLTVVASLWMTGCQSTGMSVENDEEPLHMTRKDGRIYLMASEESYRDFMVQGHMPYTKTLIGAGPDGETIVAEVDKDRPEQASELLERYYDQTFYYAEEAHDGRIYVFGNPETHQSFMQQHHMPYTKTFIGEGPNGMTIVMEVDKDKPQMVHRLMHHYALKHDVQL